MALALHKVNTPSTIYEVRSADFAQWGAIVLSPNSLRVLDRPGVYERIRDRGYHFNNLTFKNDQNTTTDIYYFSHEELSGYKALQVYGQILIDELKAMLSECDIEIKHNTKSSHIISESPKAVDFAFADDTTSSTSILIGADGINPTVHKYTFPTISPKYLGFLGVTSAIPIFSLRLPNTNRQDYTLLVAISAKISAFMITPQDVDGSEDHIGTQGAFPEQDRKGWDALQTGTDKAVKPFQKDMHAWPDVVQYALENIKNIKSIRGLATLCLALSNGTQREKGW